MTSGLRCSFVAAAPPSLRSFISELSPNTDMNDGNEANKACGLICIGILDDRELDNRRFVEAEIRRSRLTLVGCFSREKGSSSASSSKCRDGDEDARAVYDLLSDK